MRFVCDELKPAIDEQVKLGGELVEDTWRHGRVLLTTQRGQQARRRGRHLVVELRRRVHRVPRRLQIGDVPGEERVRIERGMENDSDDVAGMVARAGSMLSGLTQTASLVLAPKAEAPIKHLEFVSLPDGAALVVLVTEDGGVENRVITPPPGVTPSAMREAANFLNAMLRGRTLSGAARAVEPAHQMMRGGCGTSSSPRARWRRSRCA